MERSVLSPPERVWTPIVVADQEAGMKTIISAIAAFVLLATPAIAEEAPPSSQ